MPNHLQSENSPYLLQHAGNPVDWYPWSPEALEKSRLENKPIFLSIGYAACHWCHVMAHESFEDQETAAIMNAHFVNIKVDREERPDLDSLYMNAVVAMTGNGGWPMSVFLTPDLKPFYGGTYFPPAPRYNMPSFREILLGVTRVWQQDQVKVLESSENITQHILADTSQPGNTSPLAPEALDAAALLLAQNYDWKTGGWGAAPKFPQPMAIEFLLRRAVRGDKLSFDVALHAFQAMSKGGMYDVVGGGFARYSTDDQWLVPHFEKMLYDNAQLALVYLHAFLLCKGKLDKASQPEPEKAKLASAFRRICEETLDFVIREMTHPLGGFYSSLDADSEGEEGKYYVWTLADIRQAIPDSHDLEFFIAAYGVTEKGNFDGRTVLQRSLDDPTLSQRFSIEITEVPPRLSRLHAQLRKIRDERVRPGTDDKALTAWNGLMLLAFAEAGRYLHRSDYLDVAIRNAHFLLENLNNTGRLLRSWRQDRASHPAYLEDHAALILGLLALYQSDPHPHWFTQARQLAEEMLLHFKESGSDHWGFFDTRDDAEHLLARPKDLQDNATPSGNALAALALLQLATYTGNQVWRQIAEKMLESMQPMAQRYPTAFSYWLTALDFALAPVQEVAILGDPSTPATQVMTEVLWSSYRPHLVAAVSPYPPGPGSPELLNDRRLLQGSSTAYVCQNFTCQRPVTQPDELASQLA